MYLEPFSMIKTLYITVCLNGMKISVKCCVNEGRIEPFVSHFPTALGSSGGITT